MFQSSKELRIRMLLMFHHTLEPVQTKSFERGFPNLAEDASCEYVRKNGMVISEDVLTMKCIS